MKDLKFDFKSLRTKISDIFDEKMSGQVPDWHGLNIGAIKLMQDQETDQEKFYVYYMVIKTYILKTYNTRTRRLLVPLDMFKMFINSIFSNLSYNIENIRLVRKVGERSSETKFLTYEHIDYEKGTLLISTVAIEVILSRSYNESLALRREYELLVLLYMLFFYQISSMNIDEIEETLCMIWQSLSEIYPQEELNEYRFSMRALTKMFSKPSHMIDSDTLIPSEGEISKETSDPIGENKMNEIQQEPLQDIDQSDQLTIVDQQEDETSMLPEQLIDDSLEVEYDDDSDDESEDDLEMVEDEEPPIPQDDQRPFANRQLSWLYFNGRVLNQAEDENLPLFERLNFLGISSNNLDEFYMVRVGEVLNSIQKNPDEPDISGLYPQEEYQNIVSTIRKFYTRQHVVYTDILQNNKEIFTFMKYRELDDNGKKIADEYFKDKIYQALTPHVIDDEKPFPIISSKSLNIAVLLTDSRRSYNFLGIVKVPQIIPRIIPIDRATKSYILIEDLIMNNLNKIFINKKIKKKAIFRVVRNADISVDNIGTGYILNRMKETLLQREIGEVIRLEINRGAKKELVRLLQSSFNITKTETYYIKTPLDLTFLMNLGWKDKNHLFPKFEPQVSKYLAGERSIFEAIDEQDIILHHPYESFQPVIDFIEEAANDPDVVAIKQALYRVSPDSQIIKSLIKAAQNGKSVTVLFEVKARFDEQSNINWAEKLERVGGHVIYGTSGLKTHCKLSIVIKKNRKDNLKPYIHLGTGNYNEKTALVYTDFSFFTSNKKMCDDAVDIFNMLTGFSEPELKRLVCAPFDIRTTIINLIQNEMNNVKEFPDKEHYITIKVNSLIDKKIIEKLYEASDAGVIIKLIVRGMCLINTSLPQAKNIHVRSIVGRFLEHSRIYIFSNNGDEEIYLSSADVMERNLDRRFEIMFPIKDKEVREDIKFIVKSMLAEDIKHYVLDGLIYGRIEGKDVQKAILKHHEKIGSELNVEKIYY